MSSQQYNYSVSAAKVEGGSEAEDLKLNAVQDLPSDSPLALAHVRIPSMLVQGEKGLLPARDLLVVASHYFEDFNSISGGSYIGQSTVWERGSKSVDYKSSEDSWQIFQTLETAGPVGLEPFEIDGTPWLAVANVSDYYHEASCLEKI
jgi:hypothetical protein